MSIHVCRTGFTRQSVFGYDCSRCLSCCRFKTIQLNPYEIARLSGNRGMSTTLFIERFTTNGGTVLGSKPDGTCVFLNDTGCSVHADRPLVCRLYPLGRHVDFLGVESFSQIELEKGCKGILHEKGTLEQYLEQQDAFPFMAAADRYLDLLWHLLEKLKEQAEDPDGYETIRHTVRDVAENNGRNHDLSWIDMDRALAEYARLSGRPVPESLADKMKMHIKAVRSWAE
jgi:Fe-S-cluster containining protein